jgi:hypothetical protein
MKDATRCYVFQCSAADDLPCIGPATVDMGVEVQGGKGGRVPRPAPDVATWFPQRHLVICVAEAKLRTTLVKIFVQPRTDCVRNSSARQLQRGDLRNLHRN